MKVTERKTIFARIGRVNDPSEEALSESEVSNIAKAYKSVGIEVYNADGSFKDIDLTLSALSSVWRDLTDAQRSYLVYTVLSFKIIKIWAYIKVSHGGDIMK